MEEVADEATVEGTDVDREAIAGDDSIVIATTMKATMAETGIKKMGRSRNVTFAEFLAIFNNFAESGKQKIGADILIPVQNARKIVIIAVKTGIIKLSVRTRTRIKTIRETGSGGRSDRPPSSSIRLQQESAVSVRNHRFLATF